MGQHYEADFIGIIRKTGTAFLGIVLVGLAFSQVVALSFIRPIMQLGAAAEKLSQQNWETRLPVKGTDEISKLGLAFNQMAQAVEQRDASLSRGNRGLFMLHRTGHGLMEGLDRDTLIDKSLLVRKASFKLTPFGFPGRQHGPDVEILRGVRRQGGSDQRSRNAHRGGRHI